VEGKVGYQMPKKTRREFRVTLEEEDWKLIEKVKDETGIRKNAEVMRFILKRTLKDL
jgi:hypothetical protein